MTNENGWVTIRAMEGEAGKTTEEVHAGIKDGTFEARLGTEGEAGDPMVRWAFPKA
jgi:hypothetical protein